MYRKHYRSSERRRGTLTVEVIGPYTVSGMVITLTVSEYRHCPLGGV